METEVKIETKSWIPKECDMCSARWTHRPDLMSSQALSGSNYLCDEHYEAAREGRPVIVASPDGQQVNPEQEEESERNKYDCEKCHSTTGATFYDLRLSPLRLCRTCFIAVGGFVEDAPPVKQAESTRQPRRASEALRRPVEQDALAPFREQVRAEQEEKAARSKMSDTDAAKLRAVTEAAKTDKKATEIFINQFARLPKDTWTLTQLLKRIYSLDQSSLTMEDGSATPVPRTRQITPQILERMAAKIRWCLHRGWSVTCVGDVTFFGTLAREESEMSKEKRFVMSDEQFLARLTLTKTASLSIVRNPALPVVGGLDLNGLDAETADDIMEIGLSAWLTAGPEKKTIAPVNPQKAPYWNEQRCKKAGLCKAGPLCMRLSTAGKPAPVATGKHYCGSTCHGCHSVRLEKQRLRSLAA